jgi:hypothetical protein
MKKAHNTANTLDFGKILPFSILLHFCPYIKSAQTSSSVSAPASY